LWSEYRLPKNQEQLDEYRGLLGRVGKKATKSFMSAKGDLGRITGRIHDIGSDSIGAMNGRLRKWIAMNTDSNKAKFRITGMATLVDKNHEYLRSGLLSGLAVAYVIICITLVVVLRDWRAFPIAIIPNTIPLLLSAAFMGFMGIELKASTSIIFSVSYGVAVNNTIHFLINYIRFRKKGLTDVQSMQNTFSSVGKPMIVTSLMLLACFVSLLFSKFSGTFYIGLLSCITIVSALFADMFLTPQCIRWLYGNYRFRSIDPVEEAAPTNFVEE
jgi:predicted RND superfamily exporter protein